MQKKFYVIIDASGSMKEMGKSLLVRNLSRFISELPIVNMKYSGVDFQFFSWSSSLSNIAIEDDRHFCPIKPCGKANLKVLSEHIEELLNIPPVKIVIFSDGYFIREHLEEFTEWRKNHVDFKINVVSIGADAHFSNLKKLSTSNKVYQSENISSAIESLLLEFNTPSPAPTSINDILIYEEKEDSWDD